MKRWKRIVEYLPLPIFLRVLSISARLRLVSQVLRLRLQHGSPPTPRPASLGRPIEQSNFIRSRTWAATRATLLRSLAPFFAHLRADSALHAGAVTTNFLACGPAVDTAGVADVSAARLASQRLIDDLRGHLTTPHDWYRVSLLMSGNGFYRASLDARDEGRALAVTQAGLLAPATEMEAVHALIDLGRMSEAREVLSHVADETPGRLRAALTIGLIDASADVEELARRSGMWSDAFASEIRDSRVVVVGPSATLDEIRAAADGVDVLALVKRTEMPPVRCRKVLYLGYYSEYIEKTIRRERTRTMLREFDWVIGKFSPSFSAPIRHRSAIFRHSALIKSPSIGPRAMTDLLIAGARSVRLVGFDLYTGPKPIDFGNQLRDLQAVSVGRAVMRSRQWACYGHASHDLFGQFNVLRTLALRGRLTPSDRLATLLEHGVVGYAETLERMYGGWGVRF